MFPLQTSFKTLLLRGGGVVNLLLQVTLNSKKEKKILKNFVPITPKNKASGLLGLLDDTGAQTFNDHSFADLAPHTVHIQYMVLTTIEWS